MEYDPKPTVTSAVYDKTMRDLAKQADDMHKPFDEAAAAKQAELAEARQVFGHDAKQDSRGNFIQQGIGAPGHETVNHFTSIRRYQGEAKYQQAIKKMWRENPARAEKIGLEKPERLSA